MDFIPALFQIRIHFVRRIYVRYYNAEQYMYQNISLFYKISFHWCFLTQGALWGWICLCQLILYPLYWYIRIHSGVCAQDLIFSIHHHVLIKWTKLEFILPIKLIHVPQTTSVLGWPCTLLIGMVYHRIM